MFCICMLFRLVGGPAPTELETGILSAVSAMRLPSVASIDDRCLFELLGIFSMSVLHLRKQPSESTLTVGQGNRLLSAHIPHEILRAWPTAAIL